MDFKTLKLLMKLGKFSYKQGDELFRKHKDDSAWKVTDEISGVIVREFNLQDTYFYDVFDDYCTDAYTLEEVIAYVKENTDECEVTNSPMIDNIKELKVNHNKNTSFKETASEIGELVETKQKAYGDSFSKAYELMKVFLQDYKNTNGTYTIPEELLQHILIQVRIIDKQNRIFSNPKGDLMDESPYRDINGYSLLALQGKWRKEE